MLFRALLLSLLLSITHNAIAALNGTKQIKLVDSKQNKTIIGTVKFTSSAGKITYKLHINHDVFKDFFLSMKEMKCLEGKQLWCHIPYPYPNKRVVTDNTLQWLEHDLLFMYKKPADFGANFYNGVYYRLQLTGDKITGIATAVDLNLLASPPESFEQPPITQAELDDIDMSNHWLPNIIIE
ncbi:hypothetical protein [Psychrobium sp. 1_MG-2023]|uniref:hypothetical protein n=1 Tax=Psychrobium sp. 1_MG-2023 TaxID=3062624 RepID=UPI000C331EAC|nr:hypothetical protein [Psychrobium sp. 1_MG-2023]MDP2560475.1 hypothetical protein [Psychrobium sp. 1_MG-2023]PKF57865.1 hypothetical protein CW748_04935 [Alteromonadales bacterium alter-6D02]